MCEFIECQNGEICVIKVDDGISFSTCDCADNKTGEFCQLPSCGNDVPCYNNGTCDGETCRCSQENGIPLYYGESCDMYPACDGNPCQNGGKCRVQAQTDNYQACFRIKNKKQPYSL